MLSDQINGNIDVLLVSETKVDDSFPNINFLTDGLITPYTFDGNSNGGGLKLFVREDIPSNLVEAEAKPIAGFYIAFWANCDNRIPFLFKVSTLISTATTARLRQ